MRRPARSPAAVPGRFAVISTRPTGCPPSLPRRAATRWSISPRWGSGTRRRSSPRTEQAGIGRAVFVSTTAVTTALPAPSKRIRLAAERQIRYSRLQWTIIRPTMIYGAAAGPEPVPAAPAAEPDAAVPGAGRRQAPAAAGARDRRRRRGPDRRGTAGGRRHDLRCGRPRADDLRRAAADVCPRGRQPDQVRTGAAVAGDRAGQRLRAGQPASADPGRAAAAAGRGQGVRDRDRDPRSRLCAAAVRRRHPGRGPRAGAAR